MLLVLRIEITKVNRFSIDGVTGGIQLGMTLGNCLGIMMIIGNKLWNFLGKLFGELAREGEFAVMK